MSVLRPLAVAAFAIASHSAQAATPGRLLDGFDALGSWQALHTDDVEASLKEQDGALCLDFDFHGVSGSASLRRNLPIAFPDNYSLSFDVRGRMKPNTLQLKLIDASGDNVWWHQRAAFVPTDGWQHVEARKSDIDFAWGPTKDRSLKKTAAVELLVYVEQGGEGELCFDNLRLTPLPVEPARAASAPPATPNAVFEAKAQQVRRGLYPRGFSGEQSYWTIVGADGGSRDSALISEDGAVEIGKGGFSIEPFVLDGKRMITWADVKASQSLLDGYLPIPSVDWDAGDTGLTTQVFAEGEAGASRLVMRYTLRNRGKVPRNLTLALLARPFQVNPPTQFLNTPGGTSRIDDLVWRGRTLSVNGEPRVTSLQPVDDFVAAPSLAEQLEAGTRPSTNALHDANGFAQGALLYDVSLSPGEQREIDLVVPSPGAHGADPDVADSLRRTAAQWREKLNRVHLSVPAAGQPIVDTLRSGIAQILISRDGPALQPGTRSYARTWVRDGAMMLEGLLRTGHEDVAADFVRWYAPHQFSNGKVPCCVDARGSDPVPENDSHGELIFSIAELYRYTHDQAMLDDLWPHVARAVAYMDQLRRGERTPVNQAGDRKAFYGLMPASISHEGYSAKPMHSYWDDFWALKGYDDAVELARVRGDASAEMIAASRDEFRHDLHASIAAAVTLHHIDFIPGAAELGDFDATSTTIAVSPGGEQGRLPPKLLENTFERYWQGFVDRRDGKKAWDDYTPYELRTIATFVRLGWRDRVQELIAFFFADRRPAAWNQWAEVVGRDPRKPRFVGDMPHAWIASDYVRSALDMFAYERDGDHALVLAAGIPVSWLDGKGIALGGLRTPYGQFGYALRRDAGEVVLSIAKGPVIPPGGFVLPWFDSQHPPGRTLVNGQPAAWANGELTIRELPAEVVIAR